LKITAETAEPAFDTGKRKCFYTYGKHPDVDNENAE